MNFLRMVFATLLCFATAFGVDAAEGRRLLTMEDAILNRDLVPKNYHIEWNDACAKGEYLHRTPEG
jgi:hypothetical protein